MRHIAAMLFVVLVSTGAGAATLAEDITAARGVEPAQTAPEGWNRTYGGSGDDIFSSIDRTDDGGYVLAGWTERQGSGIDGWVMKVDGDGNEEWKRTYGGPGTDRLYGVATTDDGYLLAGRTDRDGGARGWILELEPDGTLRGERTPGTGAFHWLESGDDGHLLVGWSRGEHGVGGWAVKLGSDGSPRWEERYATPDDYASGRLKAAAPADDGGYFLAGVAEGDSQDAWAMRIGPDGDRRWERTRGGGDREDVWAAAPGDGGFVLAGESESGDSRDGWVLGYEAGGELAWEERYGGPDTDWLDSATRTGDGFLFTGGTHTGGIGSADGYVVKTGTKGEVQWEKAYGSEQWDKPWPAVHAHGGGYLLAGETAGFGAEGRDGWILRLRGDGTAATTINSGNDGDAAARADETTGDADRVALDGLGVAVALAAVLCLVALLRRTGGSG